MVRSPLPTLGRLLVSVPRRPGALLKAGFCLIGLALLRSCNRLALALDTLLFPQFRNVEIRRPLFVVGPPRSGTTLLHRLIGSQSELFTTPALWELLFAPSICQKYLFLAIARFDRLIGSPMLGLVKRCERLVLQSHAHIHPTSLFAPEEDSLALLNYDACFLLVGAFPACESVWKLGFFDQELDETTRARVLRQYQEILQRHLYVRGPHRHLLSKNPAFSGWIASLQRAFPDARFVAPWRPPNEVLASQLSSLHPTWESFGYDPKQPESVDRFVALLSYFYREIERHFPKLPAERRALIGYTQLLNASPERLAQLLVDLGYDPIDSSTLADQIDQYRQNRPTHRYTLTDYGTNMEAIRGQFPSSSWVSDPAGVFNGSSRDDQDDETERRQDARHLSATTIG